MTGFSFVGGFGWVLSFIVLCQSGWGLVKEHAVRDSLEMRGVEGVIAQVLSDMKELRSVVPQVKPHVVIDNFLNDPAEMENMIAQVLNNTRDLRTEKPELTLITFLQKAVRSYGQKKVAKSIYELAQKDLYDLIWMLAGELDTYLIFDLYNVYSAAQSDPQVLSVYQRFRAGNVSRQIVPEVFALDQKYNQYSWWARVRGRMLDSVDRYIAGKFDLNSGKTPPPIEYDENGKVIIAGVKIPDGSTHRPLRRMRSTTVNLVNYELDVDSDEDILDILNLGD